MRYGYREDEAAAATLAASFLRLGVCRPGDFAGDPVAMLEAGFGRFVEAHVPASVRQSWSAGLQISDLPTELSEYDRAKNGLSVADGRRLFVRLEYGTNLQVHVAPLRTVLELMHQEDERLPAAFFTVFRSALVLWTRVFSVEDGEDYIEMYRDEVDPDHEWGNTLYGQLEAQVPPYLIKARRTPMQGRRGVALVRQFSRQARRADLRAVCRQAVQAYEVTARFDRSVNEWLDKDTRDLFYDADLEIPTPGLVLCWDYEDAIWDLFDEQMQGVMNAGLDSMPQLCWAIDLRRSPAALDTQVSGILEALRGLGTVLGLCDQILTFVKDAYEHRGEHRVQPGLRAA